MSQSRTYERDFARGVLAALTQVHGSGYDTLYDEIVNANGGIEYLGKLARRDGVSRFSGIPQARRRFAQKERYCKASASR